MQASTAAAPRVLESFIDEVHMRPHESCSPDLPPPKSDNEKYDHQVAQTRRLARTLARCSHSAGLNVVIKCGVEVKCSVARCSGMAFSTSKA